MCVQTVDVPGATVKRPCGRDIASPGRGTLRNQDIPGSSPGGALTATTSAILAALTTGRWPHPQVRKQGSVRVCVAVLHACILEWPHARGK